MSLSGVLSHVQQSAKFSGTRNRVAITGNGIYFRGLTDQEDWDAVDRMTIADFRNNGWSVNDLTIADSGFGYINILLDANVDQQYSLRDAELSFANTLNSTNNWTVLQSSVHATAYAPAPAPVTQRVPKPVSVIPRETPIIAPAPAPADKPKPKPLAWPFDSTTTALLIGSAVVVVIASRR